MINSVLKIIRIWHCHFNLFSVGSYNFIVLVIVAFTFCRAFSFPSVLLCLVQENELHIAREISANHNSISHLGKELNL